MGDTRTVLQLRRDKAALAEATIEKMHAEHRLMHQMLTAAGIPEAIKGDGVRTCLTGRVAVLISRLGQPPE